MRWVGEIVSEQVLSCVSCSTLIPNCLSCTSADSCDMCKAGYIKTDIVDSFG